MTTYVYARALVTDKRFSGVWNTRYKIELTYQPMTPRIQSKMMGLVELAVGDLEEEKISIYICAHDIRP